MPSALGHLFIMLLMLNKCSFSDRGLLIARLAEAITMIMITMTTTINGIMFIVVIRIYHSHEYHYDFDDYYE